MEKQVRLGKQNAFPPIAHETKKAHKIKLKVQTELWTLVCDDAARDVRSLFLFKLKRHELCDRKIRGKSYLQAACNNFDRPWCEVDGLVRDVF